jgi:small-conductance mechanosensitive channel
LGGHDKALELFGVRLIGATPENGRKLILTLAFIIAALVVGWILRRAASMLTRLGAHHRVEFWARQIVNLLTASLLLIGVLSIWFDDPNRLATAAGLVTAGIAFALQRVITATAGYFVILRGRTFNVGDRIVMGGVRGDVVALSFMQTTIMEMGQPPPVQSDQPAMWVHSRQYTGRIVTVSNAKIFDQPVYNYSHHFPYIWEEISLPVTYRADRAKAEQILLDAARKHTTQLSKLGEKELAELRRRYGEQHADTAPRVFWRLTDNWLELTVRYLARDHGTRELKDAISRDVLDAMDASGITVASSTIEIVGAPPLRLEGKKSAGT